MALPSYDEWLAEHPKLRVVEVAPRTPARSKMSDDLDRNAEHIDVRAERLPTREFSRRTAPWKYLGGC